MVMRNQSLFWKQEEALLDNTCLSYICPFGPKLGPKRGHKLGQKQKPKRRELKQRELKPQPQSIHHKPDRFFA